MSRVRITLVWEASDESIAKHAIASVESFLTRFGMRAGSIQIDKLEPSPTGEEMGPAVEPECQKIGGHHEFTVGGEFCVYGCGTKLTGVFGG